MPVYHFTFLAYRSWSPSHAKGYVRKKVGVLPRDPEMAASYDRQAKQAAALFDDELQGVLIEGAQDICDRRNWTIHAVATEPTHIHLLVSWSDDSLEWEHVQVTLKRLLGMMLSKHLNVKGKRWFVRKYSRKHVKDREHFDHLVNEYFPKHKGRLWFASSSKS